MNTITKFHLIIFLLVTFSACDSGRTPKAGSPAPDFSLTDLEGRTFRLADFADEKLVLLYFWIDNCDICREEFPAVQSYYQDLKDEGFEVMAIYIGSDTEPSLAFREEFGVTFPMFVDPSMEILNLYNITAAPTNYLINPQGIVAKRVIGFVDRRQVESLLYNLKMNAVR